LRIAIAASSHSIRERRVMSFLSGDRAGRLRFWILVDDVHYGRWLAMFKTAYDVRERKQFGTYSAYDLVPR
jgi:hypothetical protein